ncbi:MAG TPA: hypothetical protein VGG28_25420 [Kofleriaceae bacterium]|jgi:hypothetical protein
MRSLGLVFVTGCALYGGPSDPLHRVPQTKPPAGAAADDTPAVAYVEDCETDFHRDARGVVVHPDTATTRVREGETASITATKKSGVEQAKLLVESIDHYADALRADPYDASATLGLAIAYDRVLRKGCALAMLRRLNALSQNPHVSPDAKLRVANVVDNPQWFKGYRNAALTAVGP